MPRRYLFYSAICLFLCLNSKGQISIIGKIVDASNNAPVENAAIFINNTSVGTFSGSKGDFSLQNGYTPFSRFEIIVSAINYEPFSLILTQDSLQHHFVIKLKQKINELDGVIVRDYLKNGWRKWGATFTNLFLGNSPLANDCEILNKHVIKFTYSKKRKALSAFADEPIVIENKALGYKIYYSLKAFSYNEKENEFYYTGYPFFEEMSRRKGIVEYWQKQRALVYYGSMLHFMRGLYTNRLENENFSLSVYKVWANTEKERVKKILILLDSPGHTDKNTLRMFEDSTWYYKDILQQPDSLRGFVGIKADSIAYAIDSTMAGLWFQDTVYVNYVKTEKANRIESLCTGCYKMPESQNSKMTLNNKQIPVEVASDGMFYPPIINISGYWGWRERIATMLPYDYKPMILSPPLVH